MKKFSFIIFYFMILFCTPTFSSAEHPVESKKTIVFSPRSIDLKEVFNSSPIIYSILLLMSVGSLSIWVYTFFAFRDKYAFTEEFTKNLRDLLLQKNYTAALNYCKTQNLLIAKMVSVGLKVRNNGPQFLIDSMKSEGKRMTSHFWQKLSILNDIIIVSPMLGLLGTVVGMFYAFYDMNRSAEIIASIFDGLGIAVGTTVLGLIVAIISMNFHTTIKYRFFRTLTLVENEAISLSTLIEGEKYESHSR